MNFLTIIASLTVLTALVGRSESTVEELINEFPNEISDVLTSILQGTEKFNTSYASRYLGNYNLTFTLLADPEVNDETIQKETYGNSVVQVTFNVTLPDLALNGNLNFEPYNDDGNYSAALISMVLADITLEVDIIINAQF